MSSVYRAHDRVLERAVAVKVLHERLGADADVVARFGREAKLVAGLAHPNIVAVIDRGRARGPAVHRLRVHRRREPEAAHRPRGPAAAGPGGRARDRGRPRPRLRARAGLRPPRRQAAERPPERPRRGEGDRLRDRPSARRPGRARRRRAPSSAPATTSRPSRPRAGRSASAPTSTRSGSSSTSC